MRPTTVSDAVLVERLRAGDETAIETLYGAYGRACFSLAQRIIHDVQLAEDVVQQVFLALWQGSGYDPCRGTVSTWLLTVTHHKAVDVVRRENRARNGLVGDQVLLETPSAEPGPGELAWQAVRAEITRDGLRRLPANQREVLLLAYYGGYTQREIATMTGIALGTVKTRALAGMRTLGRLIGAAVDDSVGGDG